MGDDQRLPPSWGPVERQVLDAILRGEQFRPVASPSATEASMRPAMRGHDLAAMLAGDYGRPSRRGFSALGLRITSAFEIIDAELPPLRFVSCTFEGRCAIAESRLPRLTMVGCDFADGLSLRSSTLTGRLQLRSARVGGTTDLSGTEFGEISVVAAVFAPSHGLAIDGRNMRVRQDARFTGRCRSTATVDLTGAHFGGTLSMASARLSPRAGDALRLSLIDVGNNLFLDNNFAARGTIDLSGATVAGRLSLGSAMITPTRGTSRDQTVAIRAPGLKVAGDLALDDNFVATGSVDLTNGVIGTIISLRNATLDPPSAPAFNGQNLRCTHGAFTRGLVATDLIDLDGANFSGGLSFDHARLNAADGIVISAQRVTVSHSASFGGRLIASGAIDLTGSDIAGDLSFTGAQLRPAHGPAVIAPNLRVGQDLLLTDGFVSNAEVAMTRLQVDGDLIVNKASLRPTTGPALTLDDADLRGLVWSPRNVTGAVALAATSIGALDDSPDAWKGFKFDIGGLKVHRLRGGGQEWTAAERLAWLDSTNRLDHGVGQLEQFTHLANDHGDPAAAAAMNTALRRTQRPPLRRRIGPIWLWLLPLLVIAVAVVLLLLFGQR